MTWSGCHVSGMLDVRDAAVDLADERGLVERRPDERVHVAGRVDVAHPVVAVRVDAEAGERVDEDLGVVAGVATRGRRRPGPGRGRAAGPSRARRRRASGAPGRPSGRGRRRRRGASSRCRCARRARAMTSRMTGPRRLPTWTVPDGVFESLTTCGPASGPAAAELVGPVHRASGRRLS